MIHSHRSDERIRGFSRQLSKSDSLRERFLVIPLNVWNQHKAALVFERTVICDLDLNRFWPASHALATDTACQEVQLPIVGKLANSGLVVYRLQSASFVQISFRRAEDHRCCLSVATQNYLVTWNNLIRIVATAWAVNCVRHLAAWSRPLHRFHFQPSRRTYACDFSIPYTITADSAKPFRKLGESRSRSSSITFIP